MSAELSKRGLDTVSDDHNPPTKKVRAIGKAMCKLEPPMKLNVDEEPSAFTIAQIAEQLRPTAELAREGTQMAMNSTVGRLKIVSARDVFKSEAADFTPWVAKNLDYLAEALGFSELELEKEEFVVGRFRCDIKATNGDKVVAIENQLEQSDHTHLGQLLTYLVGMEADIAVWICAEPREEHIKTVEWVNAFNSKQIYLVQVRFVQIGESDRAPMFEVVAGPDESNAQIAQSKAADNANFEARREFWGELKLSIEDESNPFYDLDPTRYHYMGRPTGKGGFGVNCVLQKAQASSVELYIDNGKDPIANKEAAEALWAVLKAPLEAAFPNCEIKCDIGLERGKRMSRISVAPRGMDDCGYASPPEQRQKMAIWLAGASGKFFNIVKPAVVAQVKRS
jgi:hypothetical protein